MTSGKTLPSAEVVALSNRWPMSCGKCSCTAAAIRCGICEESCAHSVSANSFCAYSVMTNPLAVMLGVSVTMSVNSGMSASFGRVVMIYLP